MARGEASTVTAQDSQTNAMARRLNADEC